MGCVTMNETEINKNIALIAAINGDVYTSKIDDVRVNFTGELEDDVVERAIDELSES